MVGEWIQRSYLPHTGCIILSLFVLAGCGRSGSTTVQGRVTIDGQPASSGMVHFRSEDGKSTVLAEINRDGIYHALDIPKVPMKVTVTPLSASSGGAEGGKDKRGNIEASAKIPSKYRDPDASGLRFTVKSGMNSYNIEMVSE